MDAILHEDENMRLRGYKSTIPAVCALLSTPEIGIDEKQDWSKERYHVAFLRLVRANNNPENCLIWIVSEAREQVTLKRHSEGRDIVKFLTPYLIPNSVAYSCPMTITWHSFKPPEKEEVPSPANKSRAPWVPYSVMPFPGRLTPVCVPISSTYRKEVGIIQAKHPDPLYQQMRNVCGSKRQLFGFVGSMDLGFEYELLLQKGLNLKWKTNSATV